MKHFVLFLISFLFTNVVSSAQTIADVSPINIGIMLVDEPAEAYMRDICEYYNLYEENNDEGFNVYSFPDGSKIEFKIEEDGEKKNPTVKVFTKEKSSVITKKLSECGYNKTADGYVKGSKFELRQSKCKISKGSFSTLIFTKEYNSIE